MQVVNLNYKKLNTNRKEAAIQCVHSFAFSPIQTGWTKTLVFSRDNLNDAFCKVV